MFIGNIQNTTLYTPPAQPYPQDFSFSGFHLGFIVWGGKFPQPSGAGDMPPPDLIMCWDATGEFCDKILRNVTVCALTSSRLDDFSNIVTVITIFFLGAGRGGRGLGIRGEDSTPQIP